MHSPNLEILNTSINDLPLIFDLFEASILYQEKNGFPTWKNYDKDAIRKDIEDKNQYKISIGPEISLVFSVCYSDPIIWRSMDTNQSVYIHRMVVNPNHKGQKLFGNVLQWAKAHARERNCTNVRMDTWASNNKLIAYYQSFGFIFIENYTTPDSEALPVHNRNLPIALLEYPL